MALNNPFQYDSRTFESLLNDWNNDSELRDKPNWIKRAVAGIGDVSSMWNNALANNLLLGTCYTRKNCQLLLELIDYYMTEQSTASGNVIFYIKGSASFPFTVFKEDLAGLTPGSTSVSSKRYESRSDITVNAINEPFVANDSNDQLTVARVYTTGEKVRLTTTGVLPSPLAADTDYYVIYISDTAIRLSETLEDAYSGAYIDITTTGSGVNTIHLYSVQVEVFQQEDVGENVIGQSDGFTPWQEFNLNDLNVIAETLVVTINSVTWTRVNTFINSSNVDTHYRLFYNADNSSLIQFGNNTYGAIPGAFEIKTDNAIGGGSDSNVTSLNRINIYGGADANLEGVSNPVVLTGGADSQTIEDAKVLGPLLLKARDRFVTSPDGQSLTEAYPGISQALVIKNFFGVMSAKVVTIASGGGNPDTATKNAIQTYLIDRSILESIDIRVLDTIITPKNVTSAAKILPGYTWVGQVDRWFNMGWLLFFNEAGKEIKETFDASGVVAARLLMNIIFSENYTVNDDFQISAFMTAWNSPQISYRTIGEGNIQLSDAQVFIAGNTQGVDYMTISVPSFPISIADDEITTNGVYTLTEIP